MTIIAACIYNKGVVVGSDRMGRNQTDQKVDAAKIYLFGDYFFLYTGRDYLIQQKGNDRTESLFAYIFRQFISGNKHLGKDLVLKGSFSTCAEQGIDFLIDSGVPVEENFSCYFIAGHVPSLGLMFYSNSEKSLSPKVLAVSIGQEIDLKLMTSSNKEYIQRHKAVSYVTSAIETAIETDPENYGGIDIKILEKTSVTSRNFNVLQYRLQEYNDTCVNQVSWMDSFPNLSVNKI